MLTIADRTEHPGGLRPQLLTTQAGCNGFDVVHQKLSRKIWRAIPLFCIREYLLDCIITDKPKLLTLAYLIMPGALGIPAAAGNPAGRIPRPDESISHVGKRRQPPTGCPASRYGTARNCRSQRIQRPAVQFPFRLNAIDNPPVILPIYQTGGSQLRWRAEKLYTNDSIFAPEIAGCADVPAG